MTDQPGRVYPTVDVPWEGLPIFRCTNVPHPEHAWTAPGDQVFLCDRGTTPARTPS